MPDLKVDFGVKPNNKSVSLDIDVLLDLTFTEDDKIQELHLTRNYYGNNLDACHIPEPHLRKDNMMDNKGVLRGLDLHKSLYNDPCLHQLVVDRLCMAIVSKDRHNESDIFRFTLVNRKLDIVSCCTVCRYEDGDLELVHYSTHNL